MPFSECCIGRGWFPSKRGWHWNLSLANMAKWAGLIHNLQRFAAQPRSYKRSWKKPTRSMTISDAMTTTATHGLVNWSRHKCLQLTGKISSLESNFEWPNGFIWQQDRWSLPSVRNLLCSHCGKCTSKGQWWMWGLYSKAALEKACLEEAGHHFT